jgi:hypothetical protein
MTDLGDYCIGCAFLARANSVSFLGKNTNFLPSPMVARNAMGSKSSLFLREPMALRPAKVGSALWFGERLSFRLDNRWFVEQETWWRLLQPNESIPFLDCVNNRNPLGAARF